MKINIMDTAGQDKFSSLGSHFYKFASGALIVFDVTDQCSFDKLDHWWGEIQDNANANCAVIILGNKCDLEENRCISYEQAMEYANKNGLSYIETSAKEDINVVQAFDKVIESKYLFKKLQNHCFQQFTNKLKRDHQERRQIM